VAGGDLGMILREIDAVHQGTNSRLNHE
jgi:hypothetical protein